MPYTFNDKLTGGLHPVERLVRHGAENTIRNIADMA